MSGDGFKLESPYLDTGVVAQWGPNIDKYCPTAHFDLCGQMLYKLHKLWIDSPHC